MNKLIGLLNRILLYRFFIFDKPAIKLTQIQIDSIQDFNNKIASNIYQTENNFCLCDQSDNDVLVAERDRYCIPVKTYLCMSCGLLRTNPRMTIHSLNTFYEEDYRKIYVGQEQASEDFFVSQITHGESILEYITSVIKLKPNSKVFEVGCGAGGILVPFEKIGCTVYGCDIGGEYLEKGKSKGLNLVEGEEKALSKFGKASLIILSHVLEHYSDPERSLKNLSGLLNENGYLYIELPGIYNIHKAYKDPLLFFQNAHLFHFTLPRLSLLLSKCGFKLIQGDQTIRAIYQKSDDPFRNDSKELPLQTLVYLYCSNYKFIFSKLTFKLKQNLKPLSKVLRFFFIDDTIVDKIKILLHKKLN